MYMYHISMSTALGSLQHLRRESNFPVNLQETLAELGRLSSRPDFVDAVHEALKLSNKSRLLAIQHSTFPRGAPIVQCLVVSSFERPTMQGIRVEPRVGGLKFARGMQSNQA